MTGAPAAGLSVLTDAVDDLSRLAPIAARLSGARGLSPICRSCPVVGICGGGLYAHRFGTGSGFDNPSVYCIDQHGGTAAWDALAAVEAADPGAVERVLTHPYVRAWAVDRLRADAVPGASSMAAGTPGTAADGSPRPN